MTTLTLRRIKGDFIVSGPDVEPMKFKSRREAKDWCRWHHPGSPVTDDRKGCIETAGVRFYGPAAEGSPKSAAVGWLARRCDPIVS